MHKHDFIARHRERLTRARLVVLEQPITGVVAERIVARILELDAADCHRDIVLLLESPGGELKPAIAIYDAMQLAKCAIATICMGPTASAAALLLGAGHPGKRVALSGSKITIHTPTRDARRQWERPDSELSHAIGLVDRILTRHTRLEPGRLREWSEIGLTIDAAQALAYGIVDSIDEFPGPA